jgi:hypothetical protein
MKYIKFILFVFLTMIGLLVIIEFLANLQSVFLFSNSFKSDTEFRTEFGRITQFMISRPLFYDSLESQDWELFDYYKSGRGIAVINNLFTIFIATIEIFFVEFLREIFVVPKMLFKYLNNIFISIFFLNLILTLISIL